ncbi:MULTISPECIES: aldehyde dehydrogenase family protein [unclassified Mesorhizobium]|uniref:aldehyde dehydrogenase family protein n=1 Tax=unclassified Mesorhizobium TaxID=325217 RepID=UPI003336ACBF
MNLLEVRDKSWMNFVNGEWLHSADFIAVENPATGQVIASIAVASEDDVSRAVVAARACVASGALTRCRPSIRAEMMMRIASEIRTRIEDGAYIGCLESGKPLNAARAEFEEAARYFEYYAGMADKIEGSAIPLGGAYLDYTIREPHGISVHIVPWNFAPSICARSLAPALAAGNVVIVKSPELTPLAMIILFEAIEQAGVPEGAVNLLCGYGKTTGAALVSHPDIDQIVFTGSVQTGVSIMKAASERSVPCVMELGGKSAGIVFADANLDQVVESVKSGTFYNAGQVCSALSRLVVHDSIYDMVVERVSAMAEALEVGDGLVGADMGPVVSELQLGKIEGMCDRAKSAGARLVTGGKRLHDKSGWFMQPTVFANVDPNMEIAQEEVFGPVLSIIKFHNDDEAFEIANATRFGLVAGVFTQRLDIALKAPPRLNAGQVFVNEWFAGGIETPFGGNKMSGHGREKGQEAIDSYVRTKNVAISLPL